MRFLLFFIALGIFPACCMASAWNQKSKEGFSSQKIIFAKPIKSSFSGKINREDKISIENKTQEIILANYLEYGINEKITLVAEFDAAKVSDTLWFKSYGRKSSYESEICFDYHKLNVELGVTKQLAEAKNQSISSSFTINPGRYIISNYDSQYVKERRNIGIAINYGQGLKSYFQELNLKAEYHPSFRSVEIHLNLKWEFKLNDKTRVNAGLFNRFNHQNYNRKPYQQILEAHVEQLTINNPELDLRRPLQDFFKISGSRNISKFQLGLVYELIQNKEMQIDVLVNPFNGKKSNDINLVISLNERF